MGQKYFNKPKKEYILPELMIIPVKMSAVLMTSNEHTHEEELF